MTANWVTDFVRYSEDALPRLAANGAKYAAVFGGALLVSLLLTPCLRELARRVGMVDQPDARRINKVPIPRGGGIAIFLAFHLCSAFVAHAHGGAISQAFSAQWNYAFLLASTLLVVVGLVDDRWGMPPLVKLSGQIAVALVLYFSGVHIGGVVVAFPPWLDCIVTVLWIVGAVNAFNFIDGMDGLAAGLALIAALGLAGASLFAGDSASTMPYLALAGACLGFLRYNFHPASVFLGDSGSMFLGLCIATFPLATGMRKELVASLGMPLLVMGVPIFDTMLAIWRRSVRSLLPQSMVEGASGLHMHVMQPDREHLHHRLLRRTMNQRSAAVILYTVSFLLVVLGLAGSLMRGRAPGLFLIAFVMAVFVVVRHLESIELWDTGRLLSGRRGTLRQGLLVPLYILADVLILCAVWMLAWRQAGMLPTRSAFLTDLPRFVVPVFVALVVSKTYMRVWSRAQIRDFIVLGLAVMAGALLGAGLTWVLEVDMPRTLAFMVLYAFLAVIPLALLRLWREVVIGLMQMMERRVKLADPATPRMLAYGCGLRFRAYLREMSYRPGMNDRVILGVLDDDVNLRGRIVAGFTVIGGLDRLADFMAQQRVDGVIITCLMDVEKQRALAAELAALGLKVSIWHSEERQFDAANAGGFAEC